MPSPSHEYSPSQIDAYLDLIHLPPQFRPSRSPPHDISFLTALHIHQIATVPYENLALHYAAHGNRSLPLDPQHLYRKCTENGRGGYCMEVSVFYYYVLRALGFRVYMAGVRIRMRKDGVPEGPYVGLRHIVNIVTLPSGEKYHVDVAFGGDGATRPLPLIDGRVSPNLGTQEMRLVYSSVPDFGDEDQRAWIYQYRNGGGADATAPWHSYYCFTENEFVLADFEVMNYCTSTHPQSFQRMQMLVVKFLIAAEAEGGGGICGKRMLVDGVVKENLGGRTKVVRECRSEEERVAALREYFGITLTEEQIEGIRGYVTELRGAALENTG